MSPFDAFFNNISRSIRGFFRMHDRYLSIGFILAFLPLPFSGFIALVIALFGIAFQMQGKFTQHESFYIASILILSLMNIFVTSILFVFIYTEFFTYIESIWNFILNILYSIVGKNNGFI